MLEIASFIVEVLVLLADIGILWILWIEFVYDKEVYEAVLLTKMSKKRRITKNVQKTSQVPGFTAPQPNIHPGDNLGDKPDTGKTKPKVSNCNSHSLSTTQGTD